MDCMTSRSIACRGLMVAVGLLLVGLFLVSPIARADTQALNLLDPSTREVFVELEISSDRSVVGQSYGPPVSALYSASGGIGTLVIPVESHEELRPFAGELQPVVIEIDLGDFSAVSSTSGLAPGSIAFSQDLGTETLAGYALVELQPVFCASQQEIDDECLINPLYCGATCVLVPGAPYDPNTGKINMVGAETIFCQFSACPYDLFSEFGDMRFTEPQTIPALSPAALALLSLLIMLSAGHLIRISQNG